MAFWRVTATLQYPSTAARDNARARLGQGQAQNRDGPALHVDLGFGADEGQARARFAALRGERAAAGGGLVSLHLCPHDDPPDSWYSCREDPRARYEEGT